MKKTFLLMALLAGAMTTSADVKFAYEAGAELVSTYLWRGQYNGGLSFQPDLEVGYDGEVTAFRVGAWGSVGASDWKFRNKPLTAEDSLSGANPNTFFIPEVDLFANFSFYGAHVGATYYNFFTHNPYDKKYDYTYHLEIEGGYDFGELLNFPLYINWYTCVGLPNSDKNVDYNYEEEEIETEIDGEPEIEITETRKRAWSSYLEIGYKHTFPYDITLDGRIGMSPWRSDDTYLNEKFAVVNLSLRLEKEWDLDVCTLSLFGEGCLNPDAASNKIVLNTAGTEKLYLQPLSGCIGLGVWF